MIENPENSLPNVTGTASATSFFVYDGDGNRVLTTVGTTTTAYIGNHTEWDVASSSLTRYYYAGSSRVAMRKNNTVYYLLSDHLGSTSLTTDQYGKVRSKNAPKTVRRTGNVAFKIERNLRNFLMSLKALLTA